MHSRASFVDRGPSRLAPMVLVAGLHVLAFYGLLLAAPARHAFKEASAFMVTLVREQARVEQKNIELPKPKPLQAQPVTVEHVPAPQIAIISTAADITATTQAQPPAPAAITPMASATSVMSPPRFDADYLDNSAPTYPPVSKRLREVGSAMLLVFVDADGRPGQIDVQSSSRHERLDQAAIEAVRRWRFVAAKKGEQTVAAWVVVPVHFLLKG